MKKPTLIILFLFIAVFSLYGCDNTEEVEIIENENLIEENIESNSLFGNRTNSHSRAVQMQKPNLEDMENYEALINGYTGTWNKEYTFTEDDVNTLQETIKRAEEYGHKPNLCIEPESYTEYQYFLFNIDEQDIKIGNTITITGDYQFPEPFIKLNENDIKTLSEKGWTIIPNEQFDGYYTSYDEDSAEDIIDYYRKLEERINTYKTIGGPNSKYDRNPANTILVTNDLLLHSFHKLFDNTLKYYEQTVSRNQIKDLSQTLFNKFSKLAKEEKNSELQETYNFLTIYWAIPSVLLVDEEDLKVAQMNEQYGFVESYNPTDEQLKEIIEKNAEKYVSKIDPDYRELFNNIIQKILSANTTEPDIFLSSYSPDFILMNEIKQDYSQFAPRSHYTDNAELKTYFIAMKWLMREKFYFGDKKLTKAALTMAINMTDEEKNQISELSEKISKLIGGDDDLTIQSLSTWMNNSLLHTVNDIENKFDDNMYNELWTIVPQKIQSTYYTRSDTMVIDSDEAKDMTAGFVFFGEKFTLDSYLFDQVTAGSAEKQYEFMPKIQTAMIIPEIFEKNSDAEKLVNLWMTSRMAKGEIEEDNIHTQYSSYTEVKNAASEALKNEINQTSVLSSIYHKWLNMLGDIIFTDEDNAPYFKLDPIYHLKNLVTYMGSYTELKHDTLLYVKQSYAELGGAGGGCSIATDPIALPVPKGYIEADIDVIEKLIELNNELKSDFSDFSDVKLLYQDNKGILDNFTEFDKYLEHIKSILLQQMNNEVISDDDFEWLRTSYDVLYGITYPLSDNVSQKETRGALIADIFTSEGPNALYEAIGRPAIMLVMIDDINGKRIALGPVFTHYEFYDTDEVIDAKGSRLNDIQWQTAYDNLTGAQLKSALSTVSKHLQKGLTPEN